jgi:hypothetical protein
MRRTLTDGDFGTEFWQQLATYRRSAWRWENQPVYEITDERASVDAFLAGHPADPMDDPYLGAWMRQVAEQTAAGKVIGRVRVLEEPPTDYQRWERWLDRWNTGAGERIDYLTRSQAGTLGVPPFGSCDWWLFDDQRLMLMYFDHAGVRVGVELTDDPRDVAAGRLFQRRARALALETERRRSGALRAA